MSAVTLNELGLQEKTIDLNNDSNSDNTITNSIHSNPANPAQTQGIIYQQPKTYAVSCEELKKLQKVNSNEKIHSSPSSLQLLSTNYKQTNHNLTESPASVSTIASTTPSGSSEQSKSSKGSSKSSSGSTVGKFNGIALLGQPIILTHENKKLLKLIRKGQVKNAPKLAILASPAMTKLLSSKKNSQETLSNATEEEKKDQKKEDKTASETEDTEDKTAHCTTDDENVTETIEDQDISNSEEEEDNDNVDKEIIYPMKNDKEIKSNLETIKETTNTVDPKNTMKKASEPVNSNDLDCIDQRLKRLSVVSMPSMSNTVDPNCSFCSLPAYGVSVQKASSDVSDPIVSGIHCIDPNGSLFIPSSEQVISLPMANGQDILLPLSQPTEVTNASVIPLDTNSSFWLPPSPSVADTTNLVVNIQGQQVPLEKLQQAYPFLGQSQIPSTQNQNKNKKLNAIVNKLKSIHSEEKLVHFNPEESMTIPQSAKVKNVPPPTEAVTPSKDAAGIPSQTSNAIKAVQTYDSALKRQSWCNLNNDILNNVQKKPLNNCRSSSFPQLHKLGQSPLVKIQMNQLLNRNYAGPGPLKNQSNVNSYTNNNANANTPMGLINIPYGAIINANAYTTHNSLNPRTRKEEKVGEKEDLHRKERHRQRIERIERWAKEAKTTACPVTGNKTVGSRKDRRISLLDAIPMAYATAGKKSKSFDNFKQMYTIEKETAALALARGQIAGSDSDSDSDSDSSSTSSSSSTSTSSNASSTSNHRHEKHHRHHRHHHHHHHHKSSSSSSSSDTEDDDDDIPLQMIAKSKAKRPVRFQEPPRVHDDNKKRHSLILKHSMDSSIRHSKDLSMDPTMRYSMDPHTMRHYDHHRYSKLYSPSSPDLYHLNALEPVEVHHPVPTKMSKRAMRRSYTTGMFTNDYSDLNMNYYGNGGIPADYYQTVPSNANAYSLKYSQGYPHASHTPTATPTHSHTHTHVHVPHANDYAYASIPTHTPTHTHAYTNTNALANGYTYSYGPSHDPTYGHTHKHSHAHHHSSGHVNPSSRTHHQNSSHRHSRIYM